MSELVPIPLPLLLRRACLEYERDGKIFDLPQAKFVRGLPELDTSVRFHGHAASTPLGPAAGPYDQLVQNILRSWLAGARIRGRGHVHQYSQGPQVAVRGFPRRPGRHFL